MIKKLLKYFVPVLSKEFPAFCFLLGWKTFTIFFHPYLKLIFEKKSNFKFLIFKWKKSFDTFRENDGGGWWQKNWRWNEPGFETIRWALQWRAKRSPSSLISLPLSLNRTLCYIWQDHRCLRTMFTLWVVLTVSFSLISVSHQLKIFAINLKYTDLDFLQSRLHYPVTLSFVFEFWAWNEPNPLLKPTTCLSLVLSLEYSSWCT